MTTLETTMADPTNEYDALLNQWRQQLDRAGGETYLDDEDGSADGDARYYADRIRTVSQHRSALEDLDNELADADEAVEDAEDWRDAVVRRSAVSASVGGALVILGVAAVSVYGWALWVAVAGALLAGLAGWALVTLHSDGHAGAEWADAQYEASRVHQRRATLREECGLHPD